MRNGGDRVASSRAIDRSAGIQQLFEAGSMTFEVTKPEVRADRAIRKKVLIVEDNDLNMKLFNDLLVAHGYGTLQTKDGVEALALARQHHPDLILMDIGLPVMDGCKATRLIREDEALRNVPIVAVSANATAEYRVKALAAGCDEYVTKPVDVDHLMTLIRDFVRPSDSVEHD